MTTVKEDIDAIAAEPQELTLESGFPIKVLRIRTRATMSLLKILTRGAGEALMAIRVGSDTSQDEFVGTLLGAVVMSIPEAEDETVEFINRIVEPAKLIDKPRLTPGDVGRIIGVIIIKAACWNELAGRWPPIEPLIAQNALVGAQRVGFVVVQLDAVAGLFGHGRADQIQPAAKYDGCGSCHR